MTPATAFAAMSSYFANLDLQVNANKTDSLLAEHKGKTLDELVAAKILNNDQKTQILKKPGLQAQLATFEEQLVQYQRVHDQYASKAAAEKADFEKAIEKVKSDAAAQAKQDSDEAFEGNLLLLSQFLRLAAYRREEAKDSESDESQAIEGVLLAIYNGDNSAVAAMTHLLNGASEQVLSVAGERLESTCKFSTTTLPCKILTNAQILMSAL